MSTRLDQPLDTSADLLLREGGGPRSIVWFLDYANERGRKVRDVLLTVFERLGPEEATVAVRLVPEDGLFSAGGWAARAAIAAHRQGRFQDFHSALFDNTSTFSREDVLLLAAELKLDVERFEADLMSEETLELLDQHIHSYQRSGGHSLPTFFIDGQMFDGPWDTVSITEAVSRPFGQRLRLASHEFFHWAASAGLVLILSTLAALLFVNLGGQELYESIRDTQLGISFGSSSLSLTVLQWINDGLMALFFLLVGIEIKREIVDGELSSRDKAMLPIVGALGGMVVPALIYFAFNAGLPTANGWGVPMATDIAFTLGLMAMLGSKVPTSLKVFVSALAIADDLGAIVVVALFYGHGFHLDAFITAGVIFAALLAMNRMRIYARVPYLIGFVILWFFVHESGVHATLAGVLTAFAIPSRRSATNNEIALHMSGVLAQSEANSSQPASTAVYKRMNTALERLREPGFHLQHRLENWSNFFILPLFAFFNTGIVVSGASVSFSSPESLGILLGLVVGKPMGIALSAYLALKAGVATLSSDISWQQLIGAGALAGVGFTMSIFIASSAFNGPALDSAKLTILVASLAAAAIGTLTLSKGATSQRV